MAGAVKVILCVYDHNKNEIRNVKAHVLSSDPSLSAGTRPFLVQLHG